MNVEASAGKNGWIRWIMVPIGLGLGLALGFGLLYRPAQGPQELFEQYFIPHHMPVLFVDGGNLAHWTAAAQAYQREDYELTLKELKMAEDNEEMSRSAIRFYRGQCLLATGKSAAAADVFSDMLRERLGPHPATRWYLALALLKVERLAECQDLLWEIEGDKGYKAGTALQLLEEME